MCPYLKEIIRMELQRFLILLNHTAEHIREHIEKLETLAAEAKELGKTEAYDDMVKAVEEMNRASKILGDALEKLKQ
jgi:hypothetical protein